MAWWSAQKELSVQPKIKSQFLVSFGQGLFLPNVKSITKPKIDFEVKDYQLLNHKFHYPGNGTWQPISIKFVDMNGVAGAGKENFDTSAFLFQVLNNSGYRIPYNDEDVNKDPSFTKNFGHNIGTKGTFRSITTPEKSSTIANSFGKGLVDLADFDGTSSTKQKIQIVQIYTDGSTGGEPNVKVNEVWEIINPLIKTISWGDLDYSSDDPVECELEVVYDWAVIRRDSMGKTLDQVGIDYNAHQGFNNLWGPKNQ